MNKNDVNKRFLRSFYELKKKGAVKSQLDFAKQLGVDQSNMSAVFNEKRGASDTMLHKLCSVFQVNKDWLFDGEGEMLKDNSGVQLYTPENATAGKRLIPLYDDTSTIGGNNGVVASIDTSSTPSEWIDPGDWFKSATAAIRHYEDSMVEYPSGCILALKEVEEKQLIIWGKDYVIETSEYRVTKRVQRGKDEGYIRAYSSNTEAYPDGQLIHEPFDISWSDIKRIFLVLGYVVKRGGGTIVFSNSKK